MSEPKPPAPTPGPCEACDYPTGGSRPYDSVKIVAERHHSLREKDLAFIAILQERFDSLLRIASAPELRDRLAGAERLIRERLEGSMQSLSEYNRWRRSAEAFLARPKEGT